MIIQVWHSRDFDYQNELYIPVRESSLFTEHEWLLPHDGPTTYNSRDSLKIVDLFITEVSYPSTGLGIEIWFATLYNKRILCLYKIWTPISSSLKYVTEDFIEYDTQEDMIEKISQFLKIL